MKKTRLLFAFFLLTTTWFSDSIAQTLQLNGPTQYVRIGDLDITGNQVTVEALVKFTGGVNIVSKHTGPANVNYLMRIGTFELTTSTQFYQMSNPYAGSMQPNTWYHVAGTYDGSFIRYYVNGCLIVEQPASGNLVVNNLITAIGNQSSCECEQFNGEVDELRIWASARTASELTTNMFDLPSPTTQTNLRAYYKFDGNLTNLQGNATYNGIWVGTPAYGTQPVASVIPAMGIQSASHTDLTCFQSGNGTIAVTATGSGLSYSLDGATWQSSNQFSNLAAGNYTIYIRSQEGCIISGNPTTVAQPAQLTVTATPTPVTSCTTNNGSVTASPSGGTGPYTYSWTPASGTGATISNLAAGSYSVQVTDQHSCQASATATVAGNTPMQLTLTSGNVTCNGANNGTATAQVTGGTAPLTYSWNPASAGTAATATNLAPGTYTATVTDAGGCTASATTTITQPTPIVITETITRPACGASNGEISVNVTGGSGNYTYQWTPPSSTTNVLSNAAGGSYTLVVSSGGCTATETYALTPTGNLGLSVTPATFSYHAGDSVQLTAVTTVTNNVSISWDTHPSLTCANCPDPVAVPGGGDEVYTVYATTPDGCTDSLLVHAYIIIPCTDIFVPSIFSPNGDGQNDMINVMGNCIKEMNFMIYDRWGEKVFETVSSNDPWDGYFKGSPAAGGAYVYKLRILHADGTRSERSGNITLVR